MAENVSAIEKKKCRDISLKYVGLKVATLRGLIQCAVVVLFVSVAAAQQYPFSPDDFVDPRQYHGTLFISRVVVGASSGAEDNYRPLHQTVGAAELANSFYRGHFQFDYKHSEAFGKSRPVGVCLCNGEPIYFPTPPSHDSIPAAPPPGAKETFQLGWYHAVGGGPAEPPVMLRYQVTASLQPIKTDLIAVATAERSHLSGRERSFGLDADTYFRVRGHDVWGSLFYARTASKGTPYDRAQNELGYTNRFPGKALGPVVVRATLTLAGVSGRGASGLNVVNPAFEAFWHHAGTDINLHLVWSPLAMRSGAEGWRTHSQIALFVDRALFVKLFAASDGNAE
jgi:hypothetical protein